MIVSCPNCATRFEVPESALGKAGRKVRCSQCAHLWLQHADGRMEAVPAPPAAPPSHAEPEPAPERNWEAPPMPAEDEPAADIRAERAEPEPRRRRFGRGAADADMAPRRRRRRALVAILLLLLAGAGAGLLLLRHDAGPGGGEGASLVDRVMAMFGAQRELPGQGLNFENVATARRKDGDVWVLVVTGEVVNTTAEQRAVPPLRGALLGADNKELQSWVFNTSVDRLDAGQRTKFETTLRQPTVEATDIKVSFSLPGG